MKKLIAIVILSLTLTVKVKEAKAQSGVVGEAISLIGKAASISGPVMAESKEIYNLVRNWKCLKARFQFYISFVKNNNDCNFNLNSSKMQDQINVLEAEMSATGQSIGDMVSSMFSSSTGSSETPGEMIQDDLTEISKLITEVQGFVDMMAQMVRLASDNQILIAINGSVSGHEISQITNEVL